MPIDIELQSPQGAIVETLGDVENVLHRTLPYYDDTSFRLLNKIDWYGETEFETAQMALLLEELDRIMPKAVDDEQVNFLQKVRQIANRCAAMPGCKVKFIGD